MGVRLSRPTFAGNALPLVVGKTRYGLPPGSKVAHAEGKPMAYVLTPDGAVHAFTSSGEVEIPEPLGELIRARYFAPAPESSS